MDQAALLRPAIVPVVFVIDYDGGHKLRAQFSDLGGGRYTRCDESTN